MIPATTATKNHGDMNVYLELNGAKAGPFAKDQVDVMYKSGTIHADTLAWAEGFSKWTPLQSILALDALPPRSAPPPLPAKTDTHPILRLFMPAGRVGRGMWFIKNLAYLVLFCLLVAPFSESKSFVSDLWAMFVFALYLYLLIVNAAKRFHDLNVTGWLSPLSIIPLVPLFLLFLSGTPGNNRYGPPPTNSFFS